MALHSIIYSKFDPDGAQIGHHLGPLGELFWQLRGLHWPRWPKDTRPDWLLLNSPFDVPGVKEYEAELIDAVEAGLAA